MKIKKETVPNYIAPTDGTRHMTLGDAQHHEMTILFGALAVGAKAHEVAEFCQANAGILLSLLKVRKARASRAKSKAPKAPKAPAVAA